MLYFLAMILAPAIAVFFLQLLCYANYKNAAKSSFLTSGQPAALHA